MEIVDGRACPEASAELRDLTDRGVLPRGTGLWRTTHHAEAKLAIAPDWYGRARLRGCDLSEGWRLVDLPEDAAAPALRALLAPVERVDDAGT